MATERGNCEAAGEFQKKAVQSVQPLMATRDRLPYIFRDNLFCVGFNKSCICVVPEEWVQQALQYGCQFLHVC